MIRFCFRFVAENAEALRRQKRRSYSPGRSRSRSPYAYRHNSRSRSRSPPYKAQVSHIARKRTRSKTPDNGFTNKYVNKSRSPRQEKRASPNERNKRGRNFKFNGNGNRERFANERDRKFHRTPPKEKKDSGDEKKAEVVETKPSEPKEKREKTEQEIEDELLASTDSDESLKAADDDGFTLTVDEKELDFLDDDEEESENEGRFKSKASSSTTQQKKPPAPSSSFKPSYKNFDKPKNFSRHDYKRGKYSNEDSKRRSRSPIRSRHKKSPDVPRKAPAKEPAKVVVISKVEPAKEEPKKVKTVQPMFIKTFKSVDAPADEKKKGKNLF